MNARQTVWVCLLYLSIAIVFFGFQSSIAIETPIPPGSLHYRRVFVPAEDLDSQIKGMIPLNREEFERRIADSTATEPGALVSHVRVQQATYNARLEGLQLVDGMAQLVVVNGTGVPAPLTLESTLAFGKPQWDEQSPRLARLGVPPEGGVVLLVDKSGKLKIPWTLRGTVSEGQDTSFDLVFPPASFNRLVLHLPADLEVESDSGIVSRLNPGAAENNAFRTSDSPIGNWLIELGGLNKCRLRVRNSARKTKNVGVLLVRETTMHVLSPVDASSEYSLHLDVHHSQVNSLKLELDAPSRIIGVRLGGSALTWRELPAANPQQTVIQVDLPEPLTGSGSNLTVNSVATLSTEEPWRLPRLRLLGSTWQEGTATMVVPSALQVNNVQLADARQTSMSPGSPSQPEQSYNFQYLSVAGQVVVQAVRETPRLNVVGGLVLRHEATQLSATLSLDLSVDSGERFVVEGITNENWIIDSVDTTPQDLLEERQFVPLESRRFALRLRLARPITSKEKIRLVLRAHRPLLAEGEGISAPSLRLVDLQGTREEQYVVALRVADNSREFQLSGDLDLCRIDPESAAPEELSLLDSSAAGMLFRLDRQAEGNRVFLAPSAPRFTAAIETSAVVQRSKVENLSIARIVPTSASLVRLYVRASGPIAAGMRWRLVGEGNLAIASQTLLPAQSSLTAGVQRESVWELILNRPTSQPITLEAAWETVPSPSESLPFFSFPEAASQIGTVRVETGPGVQMRLETAGVKPVPAPLPSAGRYSSIRGVFRYEPGRQATVRLLAVTSADALTMAWANRCLLESRYSSDGNSTHEITWHLENHGLDQFPFSLPAGVRLLQVSVDGQDMQLPSIDLKTQQHIIPLPDRRRYPVLSLIVSSLPSKSNGVITQRLTAPMITTPLKILDRKWEVTLPPGIRPASSAAGAEESHFLNWHENWNARLGSIFELSAWGDHDEKYELPWMESEPLVIIAYSPGMLRVCGVALAIALASLVVWLAYCRLVSVLLLASIFASAALILPPEWAPLAAGMFWGCVAGSLLSLVRPLPAPRSGAARSSPSTRTMIASSLTGSLLFMAMAVAQLPSATAAPDETKGGATVVKSHRVIIPIDADQKPQGDYVYVSLEFYSLLFQSPKREQLPAWLRRSATYELDAAEDGIAAHIVMRLELETLVPLAQISLPFRRGEIHLLEGRSSLDGEPVSLDWDDAGTVLRFEVERPGVYQLTLAFSVAGKEENDANSWHFNVPSAARSVLRIKDARRPGDWLLPTVPGAIVKSLENGDLLADLGMIGTIDVSRKDQRRLAKNMTEAEQFVWWQLRPGSVTADVLIRINPVAGTITEIKMLADPHLRILPLEDEPRVNRIWTEEGDPSIFHLTLSEPATEMMQVRCKFLLLNASGIGRFVVPQLEVMADHKTAQWQAISVGRERDISPDPTIPIVSHPPVDFVDGFGGAARPPDLSFEATGQSPAFLVRPREGLVRAKETVDVSIGRDDVEVSYRVDLTGIPPHRFQELIELPAGFRVNRATLRENGVSISLPLLAVHQGSLTIRRARAPGQAQQLELEGFLSLQAISDQAHTVKLPAIRFVESEVATIRVYRTPAALVTIHSTVGIEPSTTPGGAPWDLRFGYLLASYKTAPSAQPTSRALVVESRPNNPAATFRLITRMERTTARSWSAVVSCDISLIDGAPDTVRLEVPAEWSGPFEFTPPMDHQVVLVPGQTQRHLIIRPYQSPSEKLSFSVRGPVKLQAGDTPHAPVVLPLDAVRADSYLVLPSRIVDEDLQWQTSGLQAAAAGESDDSIMRQAGQEVFRVVAPRFTATLLQLKNARARASVALADVLVHPRPEKGYCAKATYYLLPDGRDEAQLELPSGGQLVQVLVNDSPTDVRMRSKGIWSVRLGHDRLPQKVVVIYQAQEPTMAANGLQAAPPVWLGMSMEKTSWSLFPGKYRFHSQLANTHEMVEGEDSRKLALEKLAAVIRVIRDTADTFVSGLPPPQFENWLSRWQYEFALENRAALLAPPDPSETSLSSSGDRLEAQRRTLEMEFLATLARYPEFTTNVLTPEKVTESVVLADDRAHVQVTHTMGSDSLSLTTFDSSFTFRHRLGLAAFLLLLMIAALFLGTSIRAYDFFASAPHFVLAIVAVACLILLPTSYFSAVFPAAAAIFCSLRRNWPSAKVDSPPSHLIHRKSLSRHPLI